MSRSVSRVCGWVFSVCLFALVPSIFAQDAQPPAAAPAATPTQTPPPSQTAPPAQTAPPTQTAPTTQTPPPTARTARAAPPEAPQIARYENKYEVSGGFAYAHLHASPPVTGGANLGGFNIIGTRWFTGRLGAAASVRGYFGTTPTVANQFGVESPFIDQFLYLGGPEFRGPHNRDASVTLHALFGAAQGNFQSGLKGLPPATLGILPDQTVFAGAFGGSLDLNRSPRIAYRFTPEMLLTRYSGSQSSNTQYNFGFTAGILYRFQ